MIQIDFFLLDFDWYLEKLAAYIASNGFIDGIGLLGWSNQQTAASINNAYTSSFAS